MGWIVNGLKTISSLKEGFMTYFIVALVYRAGNTDFLLRIVYNSDSLEWWTTVCICNALDLYVVYTWAHTSLDTLRIEKWNAQQTLKNTMCLVSVSLKSVSSCWRYWASPATKQLSSYACRDPPEAFMHYKFKSCLLPALITGVHILPVLKFCEKHQSENQGRWDDWMSRSVQCLYHAWLLAHIEMQSSKDIDLKKLNSCITAEENVDFEASARKIR